MSSMPQGFTAVILDELGKHSCKPDVVRYFRHVAGLDGVDAGTDGSIDEPLVFAEAHDAVASEALQAHPTTDQLDHVVRHAGGVKCGRQTAL